MAGDGGREEWVGGQARASVVGWRWFVGPTDDATETIEDGNVVRIAAERALFCRAGSKAEMVVPADGAAVTIV